MKLRELREAANLTQREVADTLGITARAVGNYECGIRLINIGQVLPLATLYMVSAEELIQAQIESIAFRQTN